MFDDYITHTMKVVSVTVFLLVGLTFVGASCPSSSDISPCICTDNATLGLVMDCSLVKDEPELAHAFTAYFPTSDFHELQIIHDPMNLTQGLYSLEESTLGEATFQRITITGTEIISIDGYAFHKSRSTLEVLALDGNRIHDFSFGSLASYTSLTSVLLAYNNLTVIQQIVSPFLEFLDMRGNRELVIEEKAFTYSPSLVKINLSNSKQQNLEQGLFTQLGQLQELYLSNNDFKKMEGAAIVTPNPSITYLDLSKNEISFVRHDSIVGKLSYTHTHTHTHIHTHTHTHTHIHTHEIVAIE